MKYFVLFSFTLMSLGLIKAQTVNTDSSVTLDELLESISDNLNCTSITNISSPINSALAGENFSSFGTFQIQNEPDFPFNSGIVLGSHDVSNIETIGFSGSSNWGGDSDLDLLMQSNSINATVVEFDFVPYKNQLQVDYLFASNEYPTFVCNFSDTFAFIISGPGIPDVNPYNHDANPNTPDIDLDLGGLNIATVPGTNIPINPPNIHINNNCPAGTLGEFSEPQFYDNQSSGSNILDYSGQTVPLTATANVIPGQTYHIKLVVGDRNDTLFDSAVFIDADSFDIGSTPKDMPYDPLFANNIPSCWAVDNNADYNITSSCSDSGNNYLQLNGGNYSIETAAVDVENEDAVEVSFDLLNGCNDQAEVGKNLVVEYFDGSDWTAIETIDPVDIPVANSNDASDNWINKTYSISNGLSKNFKIKFTRTGGQSGLDDINIANLKFENETLSVDDFNNKDIKIYPNPAKDQIFINSASGLLIDQFSVYDITGKLVKQREVNQQKEVEINLENFRSGIYLIKIQSNGNSMVKRFIKR